MDTKKALQILKFDSIDTLTADELKKRYYTLAKETHPDTGGNGGSRKFVEIKEAYQFLLFEIKDKQPQTSDSNTIADLTKEEILSKYTTLQSQVEMLSEADKQSFEVLENVRKQSQQTISEFEEKKKEIRQNLEINMFKLERSLKPNFFRRALFFFWPSINEDRFWEIYNNHIHDYSLQDKQADIDFLKRMVKIYGEGLNEISKYLPASTKEKK